ncbi:MAG: PKD domain-containing protein [Bacteroidia bacterium]|nr:PKD domain-containing protein [Bacteroidia bacterium]
MGSKNYFILVLNLLIILPLASQVKKFPIQKDTTGFNFSYWGAYAEKNNYTPAEKDEFVEGKRNEYLREKGYIKEEHEHDDNLIWVPINNTQSSQNSSGKYSQNTINAGPCVNIDFESGTFNGWTLLRGYNPLYNPTIGCCSTTQTPIDIAIVTGGTDPFGGFPRVYPGGGSFSARVGSSATGGFADRIEQTFFVTPANANFTYRYAVVLNDGGHSLADQPRFTSEIIDTLGNPVNCTFYQVSAGSGVPGFIQSPNNSNVIYKTWTNVAIDLTPNIGQNVTLRFTVYDCKQTGHFAYAYIDGLCTNFVTSQSDTTCVGVPYPMCAPAGFSVFTWNGPGVTNDSNQCILASLPGVYTCTTLLIPGCPGPTFTHTLTQHGYASISFTPSSAGPCATQYTFDNFISISNNVDYITSYKWDFGDGITQSSATSFTPTHNYANPGTYAVMLRTTTNRGCMDSLTQFITIHPPPNISFSPPSNCVATSIQFSNTSTIPVGTINSYTWNFIGTGSVSNATNPTFTYNIPGTYSVNLSATSNQGCTSSATGTLGIFPPPTVSFAPSALCDANGTSFAPSSSATVPTGTLAGFSWNFGDGGFSNSANPVHTYTTAGSYTVTFTAVTNHNCSATHTEVISILPSPNMAFTTGSINACTPTNFTFTNNSNIAFGSSFTHTWSFIGSSGTTTTTANNPIHNFPSTGSYTVKLIGVSNQGCPDTAVQYITVFPLPLVNFNRVDNCESAIFGVTTTPVSGTVTSYLWDFGDPGSGAANTSTLQNPTHQYPGPGFYPMQVTIVSNLNCTATFPNTVTVYPNPYADIGPLSPATNCTRDFTFSSANSTVANIGSSAITNYTWNFGGVGSSTLANPSFTFPTYGIYTVSLIAQTNHTCVNTAAVTLTIHPLPVISLSTQAFCQNVPATFTTAASIPSITGLPNSITSYTYSYGDSFTGGGTTPTIPPHIYGSGITYIATFAAISDMGCTASVSKSVDVHPIPTLTFNTTSLMCFNGPTTFTGNSTVPTGIVVGQVWDFGDGSFAGGSSTASHTYVAPGTYPVTYSVSTEYECWGISTKNVTVFPLPAVNFTTNGGCLNTVSNFAEGSTIAAPSTITNWNWNFGDNNSSTTQNPTHTYAAHGVYTPTLLVTSNNNCTATAVQTITIHPLPTIAFSPTGACVGANVQFTNTSSIPLGTINSYVWDFADGTPTVGIVNPVHNYANDATYNVTVTATSNQGCSKTSVNSVAIHPYPQASITPINSSCVLDSVAIYPNVTINGANNPISGYTVTFGDGSPANTYTTGALPYVVPHIYSGYNTYTVTLSAVSNGCRVDTTAIVKIYPKPFANFVASQFCEGSATSFVNTSTIAATYSIVDHYWLFNGTANTSTQQNPQNVFANAGQYTVSLTESSQPESGVTCSVTATKIITINPVPAPAFVSNTVCTGSPTSFTNTTPNASSITGWSWSFYNNNQLNSVVQNPSYTYSTSPTLSFQVQLKAINSFGCKDSIVDTVYRYANPIASFTATENCFKSPTIFSNQSNPGSGSQPTYSWSINNTTHLSFAENPIYTFTAAGVFSVYLTTTDITLGCKNTVVNTVTVNPLPYVNFLSDAVCIGKPTNFYNLSAGNISSFNWTFGDPGAGAGNTSTLQTPTHAYPTSGVFITTLIAVTDKNCVDDTIKSVIVHNTPVADFTVSTICAGDNTPFANLSSSGDGSITSNTWDFNGDNIIDIESKTPEYKYEVNGNYNVRLITTTEYGCVDEITKQVNAHPKPVASYTTTAKSGCPPLSVSFRNLSTIALPDSIKSITWDFGNGNPASTQNDNPTNLYTESGSYDINLTLISNAGCITRHYNPGYINVYPAPKADFRVEPEQVDEDEPVINVINQAQNTEFIKYYVSDGASFGNPNFTHYIKNLKGTKPMVVQIVKNKSGCIDTLFKVLDIKPSFTIYIPNVFTPNGDGLNDDFRPKGVGIIKFSMQIYDRWGHVVFRTDDFEKTWDGETKGGGNVAKQDVYTWKAQVTDVFNKTHNMVGHVSVLR